MIYKTFEEWKAGQWLEDGELRTEAYTEDELLLVEMGWKYGFDAGKKQIKQGEPVAYVDNRCNDSIEWLVGPLKLDEGTRLYAAPRELSDEVKFLEQKIIDFAVRIKELEDLVTIERNKNQQAFANGCRHTIKKYGIKKASEK